MISLETDEQTHLRQKFNRPTKAVQCHNKSIEDFLDSSELVKPVILWLDYTNPKGWKKQIERFCICVTGLPLYSVMRITLNANPGGLGEPKPSEIRSNSDAPDPLGKPTRSEWLLNEFKSRFLTWVPSDIKPEDMEKPRFGAAILRVTRFALDRAMIGNPSRRFIWALTTHYADGQPMVTATVIIIPESDKALEKHIKNWRFSSYKEDPVTIDLPTLSAIERVALDSSIRRAQRLPYQLPQSELKASPVKMIKKLSHFFPHYSRVDL